MWEKRRGGGGERTAQGPERGRESMWGEGWGWGGCGVWPSEGVRSRKLRQRSSTSNKGGDFPGLAGEEHLWVPFPAGPPPTSCGMLEVLPSSWPRPPRRLVQLINLRPKDGPQGWPVQPGHPSRLIILFSNSPRYIFPFSSAQLSPSRVRSLLPFIPGQCKPSPRQQGSWGSGGLLSTAGSQQAWASPASSPQNSACPALPRLFHIGPGPSHTLWPPLPTVLLVRSWPRKLVVCASLFCFLLFTTLLLLPTLSLSFPLQIALRSPGICDSTR